MKVAVAGKGGSGKTTVSGTLARCFAADRGEVLAIDADDDPNLSVAVGVPRNEDIPPLPDDLVTVETLENTENDIPYELTRSFEEIIADYGIDAPGGVTLLKAGRVAAGNGGFALSHVAVCLLLSNVRETRDDVTVVDLPNGTEHFGLRTAKDVDVMLIVVEPYHTSMETARKMVSLARELGIPEVRVVANQVRTDHDRALLEDYYANHDFDIAAVIPFDDAIRHAERDGSAPIDYDPDSRAVRAIREVAYDLEGTHSQRRSRSGDRPAEPNND